MKRYLTRKVVIEHSKELESSEITVTLTKTWNYNGKREIKVYQHTEDNAKLYYLTLFENKKAIAYAKELCEIYGNCIKHITPY